MKKLWAYIQDTGTEYKFTESSRLLKLLIWVYLILQTCWYLPLSSRLYGPDAYFLPYYKSSNILLLPLNLLERPAVQPYYLWFCLGLIITLVLCIIYPRVRLLQILAYMLSMNLFHRIAPIENQGVSLLNIVFFLSLFMDIRPVEIQNPYLRTINITASNLAYYAAKWQVVWLYAVASFFKFKGDTWLDGTAFYYVIFNDMYSHPVLQRYAQLNPYLIPFVSWFTLYFQAIFPFLVWFQKTKNLMIFFGIVFHMGILFLMGITDFGIIMMLMYVLFNAEKTNGNFLRRLRITG